MNSEIFPVEQVITSVNNILKYSKHIEDRRNFLEKWSERCVKNDHLNTIIEKRSIAEILSLVGFINTEMVKKMVFVNEMNALVEENLGLFSENVILQIRLAVDTVGQITLAEDYFIHSILHDELRNINIISFHSVIEEHKEVLDKILEIYQWNLEKNYKMSSKNIKEQTYVSPRFYQCRQCKITLPLSAKRNHHSECSRRRKSFNKSLNDGTISDESFNICLFEDSQNFLESINKLTSYSSLSRVKPTEFLNKQPFKRRCIGLNKIDANSLAINTCSFIRAWNQNSDQIFYAVIQDSVPSGFIAFTLEGLKSIKVSETEYSTVQIEPIFNIFCAKCITLECTNDYELNNYLLCQLIEQHMTNSLLDGSHIVFEKDQIIKFCYLTIEIRFKIISISRDENLELNNSLNMISNLDIETNFDKLNIHSEKMEGLSDTLSKLTTEDSPKKQHKSSTIIKNKGLKTPKSTNKRLSMTKSKNCQNKETKLKNVQSCCKLFYIDSQTRFTYIWKTYDSSTKDTHEKVSYCRNEAYDELERFFKKKHENKSLEIQGVLLTGLSGTGKTFLVNEICRDLNFPIFTINILNLMKSEDSLTFMEDIFDRAKCCSQWSVLLLDEIDVLSKFENGDRYATAILRIMNEIKNSNLQIIVIGTTENYNGLHDDIRNSVYFRIEISLHLPCIEKRKQLFNEYLANPLNYDTQRLASHTNGFSPRDIKECIEFAHSELLCKNTTDVAEISESDIHICIRKFYRANQENSLTLKPTKWDDIYGYDKLKKKLREMISRYSDESGKTLLKSFLLYGPPGCSKTMFVRALAHESGFFFISVRCSDLLSKYVGESEKSFNKLFNLAKLSAPSIIFLDEIDSLCSQRSDTNAAWVVTELKTLMSNSNSQKQIIVVGATNRPHVLDEALFCPDCFAWTFHVHLPDDASRKAMWIGILSDIQINGQIDYDELTEKTHRFSGAEIIAIYRNAASNVINERITNEEDKINKLEANNIFITQEDLIKVINNSLARTTAEILCSIYEFSNKREI